MKVKGYENMGMLDTYFLKVRLKGRKSFQIPMVNRKIETIIAYVQQMERDKVVIEKMEILKMDGITGSFNS